MKGRDLLVNLKEARDHIDRLKREVALYQDVPDNPHLKEYYNEAVYSLIKNEQQLEVKHKSFKLPSIPVRDAPLYAIKKLKKKDDSLMVENRPMKMHSFQEKHTKLQYSTRTDRLQSIQIIVPELQSKRSINSSSHFKRKVKQRIINTPQQSLKSISISKQQRFHFTMIDGKLTTTGQQYACYQRIYSSCQYKISKQIHRLQRMLQQRNAQYAILDGKKLAFLLLQNQITTNELVDCLIECSIDRSLLKPQHKYTRSEAVSKIAAYVRMKGMRERYLVLRRSAVVIQGFFRRKLNTLHTQRQIYQKNQRMLDEWGQRQNTLIAEWREIKQRKRVQIHLSSIQIDEERRLTIENYQERQNIQLSRIFRLKDENLIIIYISVSELPTELTNYYNKMMELAGIPNHRDRLVFLTPDAAPRLPSHLSLAKLLYYSPRTLNQLRVITEGLPCILYPGQPCNETVKICHSLNCYMMSGEPQRMRPFMQKTHVKRLLKNLSIDTLPGTMEMYDYGEFLNTFSVLILKNPLITVWVLKIDDQFGGRGIASVDLAKSALFRSILKRGNDKDYLVVPQQETDTFTTDVASPNDNQQVTIQIRDYLKEHLQERLTIATPSLYKSYEQFIGRFIKKGGIIEAHPPCPKEQLTYPCISFAVQPDGDYKIITTYEKILGQPYRPIGCTFPQQSLQFSEISTLLRQIAQSFKLRKIIGIFTIDLVVYKKQKWVIDINPYINDYNCSYYLFDMLMGGSFLFQSSTYMIQPAPDKSETRSVQTTTSSYTQYQSRCYTFIPHFTFCSNLRIKEFFRQARMKQFNFDVERKEGVCLLLLDQLASGTMGLLVVGQQQQHCQTLLHNILTFIAEVSATTNVKYGGSMDAPATDAILLKDVLSVFAGTVRKQKRKKAKERAVKYYQQHQSLQYV